MILTEGLLWRFICLLNTKIFMELMKLCTLWEVNKCILLFKMEQPYYAGDYNLHLNTFLN